MGLFSSKKKTYSGVGSAVQNLLSNPLSNTINTVAVNALANNKDLGDQLTDTLSSGLGSKLRSFIDYAHQKGYTKLIGWSPSDITGEVFSDASAYINYLRNTTYHDTTDIDETPEVVTKDSGETINAYVLGNDEIVEKTYTRTKTRSKTVTSTYYEYQVNWYYQGSNGTQYTLGKFFNDSKYQDIPDTVWDTAQFWDNCSYTTATGTYTRWGYTFYAPTWVDGTIDVYFFQSNENIPTTVDGAVILSTATILDSNVYGRINKQRSGDGDIYYEYWETSLRLAVCPIGTIIYPATTLNFADKSKISLVRAMFLLGNTVSFSSGNSDEDGSGDDDISPSKGDTVGSNATVTNNLHWQYGYALITPNEIDSSSKVLSSNLSVTKTVTKVASTITTDYHITEKWVNGELVSFEELEGAIQTAYGSNEVLEQNTFTHSDDYIYGSGNSSFDAIINSTTKFTEQFCPVMPIKLWGTLVNANNYAGYYEAERKLYRKLTGKTLNKWDDFIESFKNCGDSAKMIYYLNSIPINVDSDFANEYFFHFFKWLAINFGGAYMGCNLGFRLSASLGTDFWLGYSMSLHWRLCKGTPPIPCRTHAYARYQHIAGGESNDTTSVTWKGGFGSWDWRLYNSYNTIRSSASIVAPREDYPDLTDDQYAKLEAENTYTYSNWDSWSNTSSITFYYKLNDNYYEKIYVSNFVFTHYVRGKGLTYFLKNSLCKDWKAAIDEDATNTSNAGFAPIVIPIARGALESMGWLRQSNVYQVTHNVIISGWEQKTIKVKWYQKSIFSFIFTIIIIVIAIYTGGALAAALGPAMGATAGATAGTAAGMMGGAAAFTLSNLAFYGLQAVACAFICKAITWAADKFIGGVAGTIIGAVASYIACSYFCYQTNIAFGKTPMTTSYWKSMNNFSSYLKLTQSALSSGLNGIQTQKFQNLQQQYTDYQNQYNTWQSQYETESAQVESWTKTMNSWGNDDVMYAVVQSTYATAATAESSAEDDEAYDTEASQMVEDPSTFFTRTMESDFIDYNSEYIQNYEDLLNNTNLAF